MNNKIYNEFPIINVVVNILKTIIHLNRDLVKDICRD